APTARAETEASGKFDQLPSERSSLSLRYAFTLNPGSIVVMDRGYNDYALFGKWTAEESYFVTRLKDNMSGGAGESGVLIGWKDFPMPRGCPNSGLLTQI
ncbi:MAG: hypothetical protein ACJ746_17440, partial [Bryobacteraceae bacterium]